LTARHIKLEGSVSLPNFDPTAPIDLERLVALLLPDIYGAVRWACLRYQSGVHDDEIDDLSQQIIHKLIEDDCRRLRSFKGHSSSKTWLQRVVDNHIYRCLRQRRPAESADKVDQGALVYSPPQDRDIYAAEKRGLLFRALGMLSEQERLLYDLWFVYELDPIKIAAVFGTEVRIIYKRKQTLVLKVITHILSLRSRRQNKAWGGARQRGTPGISRKYTSSPRSGRQLFVIRHYQWLSPASRAYAINSDRTWGSAALRPRLYSAARYRGLRSTRA
jgi:RNA polymerase sigma factor (sigma-70 family)